MRANHGNALFILCQRKSTTVHTFDDIVNCMSPVENTGTVHYIRLALSSCVRIERVCLSYRLQQDRGEADSAILAIRGELLQKKVC